MDWEAFQEGLSTQALSILGKSGDDQGPMSLAQHMVDSGAVAEAVWDGYLPDQTKQFLVGVTGLGWDLTRSFTVFIVAAHDLGKATMSFQEKLVHPETKRSMIDSVLEAGLPVAMGVLEYQHRPYHAQFSAAILLEWMKSKGVKHRVAASIAAIAEAHHGMPNPDLREKAFEIYAAYPTPWKAVHRELLDALDRTTGFSQLFPRLQKLPMNAIQVLTGLTIMCDWIASNTSAFPTVASGSFSRRVKKGMQYVQLTHPHMFRGGEDHLDDPAREYIASFGWPADAQPRPVQVAGLEAALEASVPLLWIVEAPTGEGKTEVALKVSEILAQKSGAQGVVMAAPTMATANGLFERFRAWAEQVTPADSVSSLYLAHSKNKLNRSYNKLRLRGIGDDDASDGAVVAGSWLSGRKKGLLSNFVIGTVDQVLMMSLQMRHSMLRHLGLAGKVVIIDECHAYDAYTSSYLQLTLEWLARYGVSVIMLSATLPLAAKQAFIDAYGRGLNAGKQYAESSEYPLITTLTKEGIKELPVRASANDVEISVQMIEDGVAALQELVAEQASDGGCILVISNTIRRAQESYRALSAVFPGEVELHHSAFAAIDRAKKEDALLEKLGKNSHRGGARPDRLIVCGTQVLEQSLDIDADILITDIAPFDLIAQRVGRIHRHDRPGVDRPEKLRSPKIFVRGILRHEPIPVFEAGTAAIYDPSIILATYLLLATRFRGTPLKRPADVPIGVQFTYDRSQVEAKLPAPWLSTWENARLESDQRRAAAQHRAEDFQVPHLKRATDFDKLFTRYLSARGAEAEESMGRAQVRDADPSIEVIPIISNEYGYRPLNAKGDAMHMDGEVLDFPTAFDLASSSLRLPSRLTRTKEVFDLTIAQLERDTPEGWAKDPLLKGEVALRLDEKNRIEIGKSILEYSSEVGLFEVQRAEPK